jgi:cyanate permease
VLTGAGAAVFAAVAVASGPVYAVLVVAAFATGWGWPGLMTFTVVNANAGSAAASSAVTQAGIFVGAGLGPIVLGAVIDHASFAAAWRVVAAALIVATVAVVWVGRKAVAAVVTPAED